MELDQQKQSVHASDINVPQDPQEFMNDFGEVFLTKDGKATAKLTPYQYDWWKKGWEDTEWRNLGRG